MTDVVAWVKRRSSERAVVHTAADYGIDAPGVVRKLALAGVLVLIAGVTVWLAARSNPELSHAALTSSLWAGGTMLLTSAAMLRGSLSGKLRLRDQLLAAIPWRGNERVLDVGCGRGLMLIGAAKRLTNGGHAIGVDRWRDEDQSGNSAAHTIANARAEEVVDRARITTGDMRKLPFPDGAFDVVTSTWAIHNIPDARGRDAALGEMARVLAKGGRIVIADIGSVRRYRRVLMGAGLPHVVVRGPRLLFVIPTYVLTGVKE